MPSPSALAPARRTTIGEWELVGLTAMLMALQALAIDGMLPALPQLAADLGSTDPNDRQLVVGLYIAANGFGCLFPGPLADRFGRRPVILVSLACYAVLALACSFATSFTALLAMRMAQGFLASGLSAVPAAIIRDRYDGDRMARLMSLIFATFITVPIFAPALGQGVLLVAGWEWIFRALAVAAVLVGVWFWIRMPETLDPKNRQSIRLAPIARVMGGVIGNRASMGYVLGTALVMAGIFTYINTAQQLIAEHFGAGEWFAVVFGVSAAAMIVSNLTNARIVEKFGARRVSHAGLFVFIAISAAQVWFSFGEWQSLVWFLPLIAANLAILGFVTANFSAISMQPFADNAGAASSAQNFIRLFGGAVLGILAGQAYDGTSRPMAVVLLVSGIGSLLLVLDSEQGRLFRRLNPPKGRLN